MNHPYHHLLTGRPLETIDFTPLLTVLAVDPGYDITEAKTRRERRNFMAIYKRAIARRIGK